MEFEPVIGLEIHTHVNTKSKIFCNCSTKFGSQPNTQVCPVCLGYPGVLPVMNEEVINIAIKACLMLNFKINNFHKMDRKNYFYPDLPKNYQISQFDKPIGINGSITIKTENEVRKIGITRVHIEEDAGKLVHANAGSLVDYNRTGVPLLEIVSEPEIKTPEEAFLYMKKIKQILEYGDISDCNMEEGSLRCDANVSIRPKGDRKLGTKAEIKNVNSFKFVQKALEYEIERQINVIKEGGVIKQETRLYDSNTGKTRPMREKEEAHDYRYFPEPDLVPFNMSEEKIESIKKTLPEVPDDKIKRFINDYNIPEYDADVITSDLKMANFFDKTAKLCNNYKLISNWLMGEFIREVSDRGINWENCPVNPDKFAELLNLIDKNVITGKIAKEIFPIMFESDKTASNIIEEKGLKVISDEGEIEKLIQEVIEQNTQSVNDYRNGKTKAFGFLIGQVMKKTKGKADPKVVNEILKKELLK